MDSIFYQWKEITRFCLARDRWIVQKSKRENKIKVLIFETEHFLKNIFHFCRKIYDTLLKPSPGRVGLDEWCVMFGGRA